MPGLPLVYFARAIDGVDREATLNLAHDVSIELAQVGLQLVDPVADEPSTRSAKRKPYEMIVEHDLAILRRCDAALVDMTMSTHSYIGCVAELVYAHIWRIPTVVYTSGIDMERAWLQYHATAVCRDRDEAIDIIVDCIGNTEAIHFRDLSREP